MPANGKAYEAVFFFEDTSARGWSETYHIPSFLNQSAAQTLYDAFGPVRMALSPPSVGLLRMRTPGSYTRSPIITEKTDGSPYTGTYAGSVSDALPADVGVRVRLSNTNGLAGFVNIRGIPESKLSGDLVVHDSTWDTSFTAYGVFLTSAGNFVISSNLPNPAPKKNISLLKHNQPKGIIMVLGAPDPALTAGVIVEIHFAGLPGYNGYKTVVSGPTSYGTTGTSYILSGANPKSDVDPSVTPMYSIPQWQTFAITTVEQDRMARRKAGRPFGVAAGRAPTLFSLRQ